MRDAIAYLRAQHGVDPKRIFVLGHSEGGELVPSVAIEDKKLAGIVLLAPPAIPLDKILVQQMSRGLTGDAYAKAVADQEKRNAQISSGALLGASNAWLRSSFGIDPATLIAKVPCPILIAQGAKDIQVLPKDLPRLADAAEAAHRKVTVALLPGDNHLFIHLDSGAVSTGAEYFTPTLLDPKLFETIDGWLRKELPKP